MGIKIKIQSKEIIFYCAYKTICFGLCWDVFLILFFFLAQISKLKTELHHLRRPGVAPSPPIQRCPPNHPHLRAGLLLAPRHGLNELRLQPVYSPPPSPRSPWKPRSPVRLTLPRTQRVSVIILTTEAERLCSQINLHDGSMVFKEPGVTFIALICIKETQVLVRVFTLLDGLFFSV